MRESAPHYEFTLSEIHAMLGIPDDHRPDWMRGRRLPLT